MAGSRGALRREQVRALLAAVPVLLTAFLLSGQVDALSGRPLLSAIVLLPLAAVAIALGLPLVRERRLVLGGGSLSFFVVYCVLFSVAAGTHILEGPRTVVVGFEDSTVSNVLGLGRAGDWHYALAPRAPAARDFIVIELESFAGTNIEEARRSELNLIAMATAERAKGIAFDYDMRDTSLVDRALCSRVNDAEQANVPVVFGYTVEEVRGVLVRRLPALPCAREERMGTVAGVKSADNLIRMVPTSFLKNTDWRSLSYRIAHLLAPAARLPNVGLAQFVAPAESIATIMNVPTAADHQLLRDRFIFVGSSRSDDLHETPYGKMSGVMIHAMTANSLRTGAVIRRLNLRWLLPIIFVLCYVLMLLQVEGGLRPLLAGAAIIAVAIVLSAMFAMRVQFIWIDVTYPLLAIGGFTLALVPGARAQAARLRAVRRSQELALADPRAASAHFDVFISYNSADRDVVLELATALRDRQLAVWLDVWELAPGSRWQKAIEDTIETVGSGAVLVGEGGIGPWEDAEVRVLLNECVDRKIPVIPVLLPGATTGPKLSGFLGQFTVLDMRDGYTDRKIDDLVRGITGIRPRATA